MHVTVHGEEVEIEVSDSGVFYSKDMKFHATTLKSLAKKMNADPNAGNLPPVRVEHLNTRKIGTVLGLNRSNGARSYRIRWDDGTRSVISRYNLIRPMTTQQRQALNQLHRASEDTRNAWQMADIACEEMRDQFQVGDELQQRFPR